MFRNSKYFIYISMLNNYLLLVLEYNKIKILDISRYFTLHTSQISVELKCCGVPKQQQRYFPFQLLDREVIISWYLAWPIQFMLSMPRRSPPSSIFPN